MICKYCGVEFVLPENNKRKKFCNLSCAVSYNNKLFPKRHKTKKCLECGNFILSKSKYCSVDCYRKQYPFKKRTQEEKRLNWRKKSYEYRLKIKKKAVDYLGGKCSSCGYLKNMAALDFHHKDPHKKDFSISKAVSRKWSWEKIVLELDKCELYCSNCHRELHDSLGLS